MLKNPQAIAKSPEAACHQLYERYGAMLFGFLLELLGERKLAEDYLIEIFADLAVNKVSIENYTWLQLRRFAKDKLNVIYTNHTESIALSAGRTGDLVTPVMTTEQHYVFFHMYKCGRPAAVVAREMDLPQARVCKILAEAFTLIRKS